MKKWLHLEGMRSVMKYKKIFILGGTTEGRILAEYLIGKDVEVWLSVATDYGKEQMHHTEGIYLIEERLDERAMLQLLKEKQFDCVLDATHPYAQLVTQNIKSACEKVGVLYKRIIRESYDKEEGIYYFDNVAEIVHFLSQVEGDVLLTTGSKDLASFTLLNHYEQRLYVRMLPMPKGIEIAISLGYQMSHLICMQGPFSYEMNKALLRHVKAKYLVTKDSGDIGGMQDKVRAAKALGVEVICLTRPVKEEGLRLEQIYQWLEE